MPTAIRDAATTGEMVVIGRGGQPIASAVCVAAVIGKT